MQDRSKAMEICKIVGQKINGAPRTVVLAITTYSLSAFAFDYGGDGTVIIGGVWRPDAIDRSKLVPVAIGIYRL